MAAIFGAIYYYVLGIGLGGDPAIHGAAFIITLLLAVLGLSG